MVTDDATFHSLSLQLHPHFLRLCLGSRSLESPSITIFIINNTAKIYYVGVRVH
ncbi:hypothetical protein M3J09_005819 [Ascochyta lentis]